MDYILGTAMEFSKLTSMRRVSKGWQKDPIACVYPQILVGAGCQLTPQYAARANITHVINCAFKEDSPAWWRTLNPDRIVTLGAVDSAESNIFDWYPAFELAMNSFLRDKECGNVYVHCQCGINRSAYLALAYVIDHFDIPMDAAALNLVLQRPCALSNPSFWTQLRTFAKSRASKYGGAHE